MYINCGCGSKYSTDSNWMNIDFESGEEGVIRHNILKNLPAKDDSIEAVFSSCMLEHFSREDAMKHLKECYRVLKVGGYVRIVVPDLENICEEYLSILKKVKNDESYQKKYEYILIELIDQMTRTVPGGEMIKYWEDDDRDEDYILKRTGYPEEICHKFTFVKNMQRLFGYINRKIWGKTNLYREIQYNKFVRSGELHKWMYDEYGLSKLLADAGFTEIKRMCVNDSRIPNWKEYGLEIKNGEEYKPNSLYIEGKK